MCATREEALLGADSNGVVLRTEPETPRRFWQIARGVAFSRPGFASMAVGIFGGAGGEKKAGFSKGGGNFRVVVGEVSAG